jgi:hypothetical protein
MRESCHRGLASDDPVYGLGLLSAFAFDPDRDQTLHDEPDLPLYPAVRIA